MRAIKAVETIRLQALGWHFPLFQHELPATTYVL